MMSAATTKDSIRMIPLPNPIKYHIYTGQDLPDPWPYDYLLTRQGVFKRTRQPGFGADILIASVSQSIAGLDSYSPEIDFRLPRIPGCWLAQVLDHALRAASPAWGSVIFQPVEQMYHFHYFTDRRGWRVAIPRQEASTGQVSYQGGADPHIILELHSHHGMNAYFSPVDNRDEQGCRFYGVIGHIFDRPELRLRLGIYGDFVEFEPLIVFEDLGPFRVSEFPGIENG